MKKQRDVLSLLVIIALTYLILPPAYARPPFLTSTSNQNNFNGLIDNNSLNNENPPKSAANFTSENFHQERQLQSSRLQKICYPFYLQAQPVEDQIYILTDFEQNYDIKPWVAYPSNCQIEFIYSVTANDKSEPGAGVYYEDLIQINWRTGQFSFQADDLDFLIDPLAVEKNYTITLQGQIGTTWPIGAVRLFTLTLRNPCYDEKYVNIVPVETTDLSKDYRLFDKLRIAYVKSFKVVTYPLEDHELCGGLVHSITSNGVVLNKSSQPMAFDEQNMRIFMYTEDRDDVGLKNLTISAKFIPYPQFKYEDAFLIFALNDFPCAFDQLSLIRPSPFQNVTVFFNEDSITQDFDVNDLVLRSDYEHDCGGLVVDFTLYGEPLPENLFESTQSNLTVIGQPFEATETRGGYILNYAVYLADWPRGAVKHEQSMDWVYIILRDPCIDLEIRQRPTLCLTKNHISGAMPHWMHQLTDQYIALGKNYTYVMGESIDTFGRPFQPEINLRRAERFMKYREEDNALIINGSRMKDLKDQATAYYQVTVEALYEDVFGIMQFHKRHIQFIVTHLAIPKVGPFDQLFFMHDTGLPFLFDTQAREIDEEAEGSDRPEPFFIGLTEFGKIKLGWSSPIGAITDVNIFKETKIAMPMESISIGDDQVKDWAWITDRTISNGIKKFELKPAIELSYENQKSNKARDEVSLVSAVVERSESSTMYLKTEFENPNSVGQNDKLLVKFWRNELFQKTSNGQNVRFENTLVIPIFRQIDKEMASSLDTLASFLIVITILTALLGLSLTICFGSFMSFWIFLNSLQLVLYTVLLNIPMPSNASYFMGQLLNLLRLQLHALLPFTSEDSESNLEAHDPTKSQANYLLQMNKSDDFQVLNLLQSLRYYPSLFRNLGPLVYIIVAMATIWLLACLAPLICKRVLSLKRQKCSLLVPQSLNCLARFCYEFFLEIFLCGLLSLSMASNPYDFFTGLVLTWIMIIGVSIILVLFYKGGPYLKKGVQAYEQRTPQNSLFCYQARKIQVDVEKMTEERRLEDEIEQDLEPAIQIEQGTMDEIECESAGIPETERNFLIDLKKDLETSPAPNNPLLQEQKNELQMVGEEVEQTWPPLGKKIQTPLIVPEIYEGGQSYNRDKLKLIPGERQRQRVIKESNARNEAKKRLMLEDLVIVKHQYKTLFSGLKLGHPENVAVVNPLVFLLRRVFFSCAIIFMGKASVLALSLLQIFCLFSLCYNVQYRQWTEPLLNMQHLVNEVFLYAILSLELCISAHEEMVFKQKLGEALISLVVLAMAFNLTVCLQTSVAHIRLLFKRLKQQAKSKVVTPFNFKASLIRRLSTIYEKRRNSSGRSKLSEHKMVDDEKKREYQVDEVKLDGREGRPYIVEEIQGTPTKRGLLNGLILNADDENLANQVLQEFGLKEESSVALSAAQIGCVTILADDQPVIQGRNERLGTFIMNSRKNTEKVMDDLLNPIDCLNQQQSQEERQQDIPAYNDEVQLKFITTENDDDKIDEKKEHQLVCLQINSLPLEDQSTDSAIQRENFAKHESKKVGRRDSMINTLHLLDSHQKKLLQSDDKANAVKEELTIIPFDHNKVLQNSPKRIEPDQAQPIEKGEEVIVIEGNKDLDCKNNLEENGYQAFQESTQEQVAAWETFLQDISVQNEKETDNEIAQNIRDTKHFGHVSPINGFVSPTKGAQINFSTPGASSQNEPFAIQGSSVESGMFIKQGAISINDSIQGARYTPVKKIEKDTTEYLQFGMASGAKLPQRRASKKTRMFSSRPNNQTQMSHSIFAKEFGVSAKPALQPRKTSKKKTKGSKSQIMRVQPHEVEKSFLKHPYAAMPAVKNMNQLHKRSHSEFQEKEKDQPKGSARHRLSQRSPSVNSGSSSGQDRPSSYQNARRKFSASLSVSENYLTPILYKEDDNNMKLSQLPLAYKKDKTFQIQQRGSSANPSVMSESQTYSGRSSLEKSVSIDRKSQFSKNSGKLLEQAGRAVMNISSEPKIIEKKQN